MDNLLRVLIVEDSEDDTALLLRELKQGGYEPVFRRVDTASAMIEALNEEQWDVVISDYVMPEFNGLAALKLTKEMDPDLPFIIVSGKIGEDIAVEAMKAGAHDYIMKDNFSRLVPAIDRELNELKIRKERKKVVKALKESETLYKTIFENTGTATMITEDDTTISLVNSEFEKLSGYSKREIETKKSWTEFFIEKDLERMKEYHRLRTTNHSIPSNYETHFIDNEGNVRNVFITVSVIPGTRRSVASLLDITEHKKADEALKKREERLRLITDNMNDVICQMAIDGIITYVSPSIKQIYGFKPQEIIGKNNFDFVHPEDLKNFNDVFKESISTGKSITVEYRAKKADGR